MKILDILGESLRTERITQHHVATELRALYDDRREIKRELNDARITGDDEDEIASLVQQLADVDEQIQQLEGVDLAGVTESIDHKEMLRGLQQALTKASADLAEMEDDLRVMKGTARTEEELDAVDDYRTQVEKKRALVGRLTKRVKLRKAALGGAQ